MKIIKKFSKNDCTMILFATSKKELELIYGICQKAYSLFPDNCPETMIASNRLHGININFGKALDNWDKIPIEQKEIGIKNPPKRA